MRAGACLTALIAIILLLPGVLTACAAEEVDLLLVLSSDFRAALIPRNLSFSATVMQPPSSIRALSRPFAQAPWARSASASLNGRASGRKRLSSTGPSSMTRPPRRIFLPR
jgi:hypothetical protein